MEQEGDEVMPDFQFPLERLLLCGDQKLKKKLSYMVLLELCPKILQSQMFLMNS